VPLVLFVVALWSQAATAETPLSFSSGPQRADLVELYTSEGCSSCPAADRWLSSFIDAPGLWSEVVPVAFHVSYWDRLGWPDRFARKNYDLRQRLVAAAADAGVYTPGVFRNGREYRHWRNPGAATKPAVSATGSLRINQISAGRWQLDYADPRPADINPSQPTQAFMVLLGNGLTTAVQRGENAGRQLRHDFVVLDLAKRSLTKTTSGLSGRFRLRTTEPADKSAVAAWVVSAEGEPLQAVGGYLR